MRGRQPSDLTREIRMYSVVNAGSTHRQIADMMDVPIAKVRTALRTKYRDRYANIWLPKEKTK